MCVCVCVCVCVCDTLCSKGNNFSYVFLENAGGQRGCGGALSNEAPPHIPGKRTCLPFPRHDAPGAGVPAGGRGEGAPPSLALPRRSLYSPIRRRGRC